MKRKIKMTLILFFIFILLCLWVLLWGIRASRSLTVTRYTVPLPGLEGEVSTVLLSDLHEEQFGGENGELVRLVAEQQPRLILLAGDLVSRDHTEEELERALSLIHDLAELAPVYLSWGNHETDYMAEHGDGLTARFEQAGAVVLEGEYADLTVDGVSFRLGGMSQLAYRDGSDEFFPGAEEFLTDFCSTHLPTVLLSHRPEAFSFKNACSWWPVDLILSGHTHGGLVRLPLIGGLYAPIQGLFPKTVYGEYTFFQSKMIVTSGLAGYGGIPRVFNPPEVCVVTLVPENTARG